LSAAVITARSGYQPVGGAPTVPAPRVRRVTSTSRCICSTRASAESNFRVGRWKSTNSRRTVSPYSSRSWSSWTYASTVRRVRPDGDGRGGPGQRGDVGMGGVLLDDGEVTGVDAVGRDQPSGLRTEVRGGEAELTTTLVPSVDDRGDGVEPAQHPGGLAHLALQQGLTDGGGGDAPAVGPLRTEVGDGDHLEVVAPAELAHGVDRAGIGASEQGVLSEHDGPHTQPFDHEDPHEVLGRMHRELAGELQVQ